MSIEELAIALRQKVSQAELAGKVSEKEAVKAIVALHSIEALLQSVDTPRTFPAY